MDPVQIDIEDVLDLAGSDRVIIRFGNKEIDDPYLELTLDAGLAKDGRVRYAIKEGTPTGELVQNMASPLFRGSSLKELNENYQRIGLKDAKGEWIEK